jgi:hypothetical protein
VNASSTRNGKRILSQLQEATQSHRVSQNKGEGGQLLCSLTPSMLKKKYCDSTDLKYSSPLLTRTPPLYNEKVVLYIIRGVASPEGNNLVVINDLKGI